MADECQAMAYTSCNSVQPVSARFPRGLDSINFDLRAQCALGLGARCSRSGIPGGFARANACVGSTSSSPAHSHYGREDCTG